MDTAKVYQRQKLWSMSRHHLHFGQAAFDGAIAWAEKMDISASGIHEDGACEVRLTSNTRVDLGGIVGGAPALPYAMAGGHCTGTASQCQDRLLYLHLAQHTPCLTGSATFASSSNCTGRE